MRGQTPLLLCALLGARANAHPPRITAAPIVQRDISNIEIHQDYVAPIGVDTQYLTQDGQTTKVSFL